MATNIYGCTGYRRHGREVLDGRLGVLGEPKGTHCHHMQDAIVDQPPRTSNPERGTPRIRRRQKPKHQGFQEMNVPQGLV